MCKVSILVPTKNRSAFISRLLAYYASFNNTHPIYIGDGSDEDEKKIIQSVIEQYAGKLQIYYFYFPELNDRQTFTKLAELSKETYCAFVGDDDYLIPSSLSKCADFLSNNASYRTAQGKAVLFTLNESGAYGTLKGSHVYWDRKEIEFETAVERVNYFSRNYWVPQFSVHRREEFLADSVEYCHVTDKSFGEILHCFTFACNGKSKFIDCLYLVRQGHNARYVLPGILDWLTGETWHDSFKVFIQSLGRCISKCDSISIEDGEKIIKEAFTEGYLKTALRKQASVELIAMHQSPYNRISRKIKSLSAGFFEKNPDLRRQAKRLRNKLTGNVSFDFDSLLQKNSAYYADAKGVYDNFTIPAVTNDKKPEQLSLKGS